MDFKADLITFLRENEILAFASTDGKHTYACNLHFSSDDALNLYFASTHTRKHITNIIKHAEVAVCIYGPEKYDDATITGVQMRGICTPCDIDKDIDAINAFYQKFPGKFDDEKNEALIHSDLRTFYKITPHWVRMMKGHSWDYPHELTLPEHQD